MKNNDKKIYMQKQNVLNKSKKRDLFTPLPTPPQPIVPVSIRE